MTSPRETIPTGLGGTCRRSKSLSWVSRGGANGYHSATQDEDFELAHPLRWVKQQEGGRVHPLLNPETPSDLGVRRRGNGSVDSLAFEPIDRRVVEGGRPTRRAPLGT